MDKARLQCQVVSHPQVFIRELISNGSDALEKLRHRLMAEGKALPEMEIHLQTDSGKGTITIQVAPFGNCCCHHYPLSLEGPVEAERQCSPVDSQACRKKCSVLSRTLVQEAVTSGFYKKPPIYILPTCPRRKIHCSFPPY